MRLASRLLLVLGFISVLASLPGRALAAPGGNGNGNGNANGKGYGNGNGNGNGNGGAAPEIDPAGLPAALSLLVGGTALLRHRTRRAA